MKQVVNVVNIDGKLFAPEEAKISVFDHGFLFGDSIYETMRTYGKQIFLLDQHLRRLENSARMMRLNLPLSLEEIGRKVVETVQATSNEECYIRLIVTRGAGKIGLDIDLSARSSYVIIVNPLEPLPADWYENGVRISLVSIRRNDQSTVDPRIKSSNLLNNILAFIQAKDRGAFEGILCNLQGYVTEGTGTNLFLVRDRILLTPALEAGLLQGVTRALVLKLAKQLDIPATERNIYPEELLKSEECFLTSTTKAILPVAFIDGARLQPVPGPVTKQLMRAYEEFVKSGGSALPKL